MNAIPARKLISLLILLLLTSAMFGACSGCSCSEPSTEDVVSGSGLYDRIIISDADIPGGTDVSSGDVSPTDLTDVPTTTATSTSTSSTSGSTTSSTSTTQTTTTTKSPDEANNADYVVNPNYESRYYIVVYTGSQSVVVYSKDDAGAYNRISACFTCSTGASSSPTRTGQYKIRAKYRWRWLVGNVYGQYSSSISSSYLFHSVPYLRQDPSTLDMNEYDKLGSGASHGCIRLCVRDAKWIYDNCPIGTQVNIVNASGPYGHGYPARNPDSIYSGWDPSDPNPSNPYLTTPTTSTTTTTSTESSATTSETTSAVTTVQTTSSIPDVTAATTEPTQPSTSAPAAEPTTAASVTTADSTVSSP